MQEKFVQDDVEQNTKEAVHTSMDEAEFKRQLRQRGEEYAEYEKMVGFYAKRIRNVQGMLRGSMVMAFRAGVISMLDLLDNKAREARYKRDLALAAKQDFLGESSTPKEKGI